MRGNRRAFAVVLALMIAYEAYTFFVKEAGQSENIASRGDWHLTGEVAGPAALVQGFVVHADGFDGVDVWAHASSATAAPRGPIVVEIVSDFMDPTGIGLGSASRVARVSYPATEVTGAPQPFHVPIPRVDKSAGQAFHIIIRAPEAARGEGVRFEASGPTYPQGVMTLGGREEWGDLQFRTSAERSTIYRNVRHMRQSTIVLPSVLGSDVFLVLMVLLFNAVLAVLLYDIAFAEPHEN